MAGYDYQDVVALGVVTLVVALAVTLFADVQIGKMFAAAPLLVIPLYAYSVPLPHHGSATTDQLAHAASAGFLALMFTLLAVLATMVFAIPVGEDWQRRRREG